MGCPKSRATELHTVVTAEQFVLAETASRLSGNRFAASPVPHQRFKPKAPPPAGPRLELGVVRH